MADSSGQADIRGLDIDKLAKGFADEENVFKKFVTVTNTSAREIRWYKKTNGFLDTTTTSGITKSGINPAASGTRPEVVEQSWTRQTSYVQKFFVESPTISQEDIKDSDIDILATNVRDLVKAVGRKVDLRIFSILNEASEATPTVPNPTNVNTAAATGTGWDDETNGNPVKDLLVGKRKMRQAGYDPKGAIVSMNSIEHEFLIDYLIRNGSNTPQYATEKLKDGVVMALLGCNVVVTENQTTDYITMWIPRKACTWKQFMPLTAHVMDDPGIGKKIRVWEEGEAILTDPKAVHIITDTTT